jgi:hypothetical protein
VNFEFDSSLIFTMAFFLHHNKSHPSFYNWKGFSVGGMYCNFWYTSMYCVFVSVCHLQVVIYCFVSFFLLTKCVETGESPCRSPYSSLSSWTTGVLVSCSLFTCFLDCRNNLWPIGHCQRIASFPRKWCSQTYKQCLQYLGLKETCVPEFCIIMTFFSY